MEITLQEILAARENRVALQHQLLREYAKPLVCFTMNIAGPVKNSELIQKGFFMGHDMLLAQLSQLDVLHWEQRMLPTGCEGYYVVDADPMQVKALTAQIEDSTAVARLFDMDVLDAAGSKINREALGLPARKCLLCENPVYICSSRRAHSAEQLQQETNRLLLQAVRQEDAAHIGALATQSLLYEVCTTPKPGLVDRWDSGSHQDMDIFTFMASTAALQPYFTDCARIGIETAALPAPETFRKLRLPGKLAEMKMKQVTGGVNTHKGAIFSLGILCAAAGRLSDRSPKKMGAECKAMLTGITMQDMGQLSKNTARTVGETLFVRHGITGIRGQAEQGFPAVLLTGLPVLEQGLEQGFSLNDAGRAALLHLFCADTDTTFIARSDLQAWQQETRKLASLLAQTPYPDTDTLQQLNRQWIQKNLSAGGSADLLALTYFLHFLCCH